MQNSNATGLGIDYVETPRIREHLAKIAVMQGTHGRSDSDILVLKGPPRSGKTTLLNHYARRFRAGSDEASDIRPIVFARCPEETATPKSLAWNILEALQVDVDTRATTKQLVSQIVKQLNEQRTELLVLEDMSRLCTDRKSYKAANLVTDLCEDGRTPIIIAGHMKVQRLFEKNGSLCGRIMEDITLTPYDWSVGADKAEFTGLLTMLARAWKFPPGFEIDEDVAHRMAWAHGGLVGNVVQHMKRTEKEVSVSLELGRRKAREIYWSDLAGTYLNMRIAQQAFKGVKGRDDPFDLDTLVPTKLELANMNDE